MRASREELSDGRVGPEAIVGQQMVAEPEREGQMRLGSILGVLLLRICVRIARWRFAESNRSVGSSFFIACRVAIVSRFFGVDLYELCNVLLNSFVFVFGGFVINF